MKIKTKKLRADIARKIVASLMAGGLICTGSLAFAADANGNNKIVSSANYEGGRIQAGYSNDGEASDNNLEVSDVDVNEHVNAGETSSSTGNANGNKTTVRNVNNISFLHGGYAPSSNGSSSHNIVNIWNSTINHIHGGHIGNGYANYNKVYFYSGTVSELTGAGFASSGEASFNELYVYGGTLNGLTQGGYVYGDGRANSNLVEIHGGTVNGDIYGGYVGTDDGNSEVRNNTIRIYGGDVSNANIYAGYLGGNTNLYGYGNALEFYTKDITAQQIGGFDTLRFNLPSDTSSGDRILTLTGSAQTDLSQTAIHMFNNNSNLKFGDSIDLVSNETGVSFDAAQITSINSANPYGSPVLAHGISWVNRVNFEEVKDANNETVALRANIGERVLNPDVKILNQGVTENHSALDRGTDRILNWLPPEEVETRNINETTQFEMFMGMGGGITNIDTGNGTKLRNKDGGTNIGFARVLRNRHGLFIFAPITDYGTATYNSNVTDGFGTRGGGHSQYFTAGLIARQWNTNGMYYEASFRAGRMKTGFSSDNFWTGSQRQHISYSEETPCYTGHVRIGWRGNVSPQNILDLYGVYSQNHIGAIDANISPTDQNYRIESDDSKRFRIGARLTRVISDHNRFYSGLAYQYERGGRGLSKYMDTESLNGGLKGSSGMIELGWQLQPTPNSAVMLDSALVGWIGKQKGISFQCKLKKEF